MEPLDWLRAGLAAHPLVAAIAAAAIVWPGIRWVPAAWWAACARLGPVAALVAIGAYAAIAVGYGIGDHYFDPAEPTMAAVGWIAAHGQPLYPALDDPGRYAHVYGPLAFLVHGIVLRMLGASLAVSKGLGIAAGLASLWCLWAALRRIVTARAALVATAACVVLYLGFRNYTFWGRPEPFLLLLVSAAVWTAGRSGAMPAVFVGVAAGLAVDFKLTAVLYFVPIFTGMAVRERAGTIACAVAAAAGCAMVPFLLPNVSLWHYLDWLAASARSGVVAATLRHNLEWIAFLLVPLAALAPGVLWRRPGVALIGSMALVAVAAAKPGGGPYHLLPFVPVMAGLVLTAKAPHRFVPNAARAAVGSVLLVALMLAVTQQRSWLGVMRERDAFAEGADLRAFLASHPGDTVHVGHGRADLWTFVRPLAVFATDTYLIDAPAVQEYQRAGLPMPTSTIAALRACRIDVWLLPKGGAPFEGANRYAPASMPRLFPAEFVDAFEASYARVGATRYFDVWRCRTPAPPNAATGSAR